MLESMIEIDRLRRIGMTMHIARQLASMPPLIGEPNPMRVVEVQRAVVQLHDGEQVQRARVLPALQCALHADGDAIAVGDWVLAEQFAHGEWWVHSRMPPLSQLVRRSKDAGGKLSRQVIVSNVDVALLVMGLDLDFSLRRLERYLALARLADVAAVVVLSKADTCAAGDTRLSQACSLLRPQDDAAVSIDARSPNACDALAPWLGAGRTLVLLGSSGAGKSTLTNTLCTAAAQAIGSARLGDGRGRHTTTSRSMHFTRGGACIIDTPGLRTLRLDADASSLDEAFDDIARLQPLCRFRNCRHASEPGCAVRARIAPERLRNYQKLLRETRRDALSLQQRHEQLALWKSRARLARQVADGKRG